MGFLKVIRLELLMDMMFLFEMAQKWVLKLASEEGANDFAGFEEDVIDGIAIGYF